MFRGILVGCLIWGVLELVFGDRCFCGSYWLGMGGRGVFVVGVCVFYYVFFILMFVINGYFV